ncbi:hypothetical protein [Sphingobacterium wenxiniae]|uniref:Uncharacterized protein n=1 Tax=Sphingobacterium wenxiniae TaxID=683125 RepID=A0A1I6RA98_9SPHI|nr:hypothetical protein [Sphingobacterium wenxiniae]SFS61632.1 hypothetical protein SAMN05660206_103265 [Sphingobacterium wenxiniae]
MCIRTWYIFLATAFSLLLGLVQVGYGQRIYADAQQPSNTALASVSGAGNAVDLPDTTNYSTLNVTLGIGGLIHAQQNLQFVNNPKPSIYSPVVAKIGSNSSLLTLLGGFVIQRTNGGINSLVAPSYSVSELLNLLQLLGGNTTGNVVFPPTGNSFDGIRFEVNSLLGIGITARYYYAFYIVPPTVSESDITLCQGATQSITISNFQTYTPYTYRFYNSRIGGVQIDMDVTTSTFTIPANWEGSYWLEAREHNAYPSARTEIKIIRNKISGGIISGDQTICEGDNPVMINGSLPDETTVGATIVYQWQKNTSGTYETIVGATTQNYLPIASAETAKYQRKVTSTLNGTVCESLSNEITITVKPKPPAPNIELHPNSQY